VLFWHDFPREPIPGFKKRHLKTRFMCVYKSYIENGVENALKTVALLTSLKTVQISWFWTVKFTYINVIVTVTVTKLWHRRNKASEIFNNRSWDSI
jgi:hypothetical protein